MPSRRNQSQGSVRTEVLNGMCLAPVRRRQKAGAAEMLGGIMQREQRGGEERGADSGKRAKGHGEGLWTGGAGGF